MQTPSHLLQLIVISDPEQGLRRQMFAFHYTNPRVDCLFEDILPCTFSYFHALKADDLIAMAHHNGTPGAQVRALPSNETITNILTRIGYQSNVS